MSFQINSEILQAIEILPNSLQEILNNFSNLECLTEIVIDLGRPIELRFSTGYERLEKYVVSQKDIDSVIEHISGFGVDNRAGIEGTLHRISGIRNRAGHIIGLTCRVGRAVQGAIDSIIDIVRKEKSICLLGPPGVGKTTILRECARILAEDGKRVVIIDTSNEIGGDGDIPHCGIGRARRMQVVRNLSQEHTMIEAVENHMPEIIIVDEIGTEAEALAARTIAERGVQLIATAHGKTLENILMNPTLSDLVGGINTVTLSDEEAKRRGTRKTVLERKSPPTFEILVEIQDRNRLAIWQNVAETVDALLRGYQPQAEIRQKSIDGTTEVIKNNIHLAETSGKHNKIKTMEESEFVMALQESELFDDEDKKKIAKSTAIFAYGVSRNKIQRAINSLEIEAHIVHKWDDADVILTLKHLERKESEKIKYLAEQNIPICCIKTNTTTQIIYGLKDIFALSSSEDEDKALHEANEAIYKVLLHNEAIELMPQVSYVRRLQHKLAQEHNVLSRSTGMEPNRRVLIFRENDLPYRIEQAIA